MSECPKCGAAAYVGLLDIECSNVACDKYAESGDPDKTPKMWRKPIWQMTDDEIDALLADGIARKK